MGCVDCRNELFCALTRRPRENLVCGARFNDIARLEKDDVLCNFGSEPQVVCRDHHGGAFLCKFAQNINDFGGEFGVKGRGGLIA